MAENEQLHQVEYMVLLPDGKQGKVTQHITQSTLGKLLLTKGITLLNVNHNPPAYISRKKKK